MNYFNKWYYTLEGEKFVVSSKNKFWKFIGGIPIINNIVYYIYEWFHKKDEVLIIECKYCDKD